MRSVAIRLPWPEAPLHPNARIGRRKVLAAERKARVEASRAVERHAMHIRECAHLRVIFYPPDERRRATANMVMAIKSYLDGIAAGAEVDPSGWSFLIRKGQSVPRGLVVIHITDERLPPI